MSPLTPTGINGPFQVVDQTHLHQMHQLGPIQTGSMPSPPNSSKRPTVRPVNPGLDFSPLMQYVRQDQPMESVGGDGSNTAPATPESDESEDDDVVFSHHQTRPDGSDPSESDGMSGSDRVSLSPRLDRQGTDESTVVIPDSNIRSGTGMKRKCADAELDGPVVDTAAVRQVVRPTRPVKRRASKACQCCRARKVRCNVTEHGAPCTNCRLDEVECVVSESRRKKKWTKSGSTTSAPISSFGLGSTKSIRTSVETVGSVSPVDGLFEPDVQHALYPPPSVVSQFMTGRADRQDESSTPAADTAGLPDYIRALPSRIGPDEIGYLAKKGSLTIPDDEMRNELIRAYIDYVQPYMPVLDVREFVTTIDGDGSDGELSLLLFQAVMFAGSAFVEMDLLEQAGYRCRKEARKAFFRRARLLYDFDYETDRLVLVQALLLLTYYYETPDDQKDTWHWMGVATSIGLTIGLHRNLDRNTGADPRQVKLRKRIWWASYLRDRMIAIGMRRPTRIKNEDYDVPMLTVDDFDTDPLPDSIRSVPSTCVTGRDGPTMRTLAVMCIAKIKLSVCISHILAKQYCVLSNNVNGLNDRTTMMLLPKRVDPDAADVKVSDEMLQQWFDTLPVEARWSAESSGNPSVDLNRALLHLVYYTTLSALHRPQVLPSAMSLPASLVERSRRSVRQSATAITAIASLLESRRLVRFLPTSGVTVLLPAIIIHLLDIKAPEEAIRRASLDGFFVCMRVMGQLRDLYAAADYSTAFLEAAIRKAGVQIGTESDGASSAGHDRQSVDTHIQMDVETDVNVDVQAEMEAEAGHPTVAPPGTVNPGMMSAVTESTGNMSLEGRLEEFLNPCTEPAPAMMNPMAQPVDRPDEPSGSLNMLDGVDVAVGSIDGIGSCSPIDFFSFPLDELAARAGQGLMLWDAAAAAGMPLTSPDIDMFDAGLNTIGLDLASMVGIPAVEGMNGRSDGMEGVPVEWEGFGGVNV